MFAQDVKTSNSVLNAIAMRKTHKFVLIRENHLADASFLLVHLCKQILSENVTNKVCLLTLHHPIRHYQNLGKKLGLDLDEHIRNDHVRIIDVMQQAFDYLNVQSKDDLVKTLFLAIQANLNELMAGNGDVYLIIDDLSHLLDLELSVSQILSLINAISKLMVDARFLTIMGIHCAGGAEEIVANSLNYEADLIVGVSQLKTGLSRDVTGVMSIERDGKEEEVYHYKAYDRGIRVFTPGGSLNYLYK